MLKHLIAAALVAATASPVFASSGYGPAPHYSPLGGAPASQRGQSALTVRAEQADVIASADDTASSYGGRSDMTSQSGARVIPAIAPSPYSHH